MGIKVMNWTGSRLKKWRIQLGYNKYGMGDLIGIGHIAYNKIEGGYIIPIWYSDELDVLYHVWKVKQMNKKEPGHNIVQRGILRQLGLGHLINYKTAV